jgi:hypothetical protein
MKVVVSFTTIPPRMKYLENIIAPLMLQTCHEVWVNIPQKYNRFPDWDGQLPDLSRFGSKLKINRDCEDLGPGTKFMGPAPFLEPDDLIVYVDDDTSYEPKLVTNLLKWFMTDTKSAWGLSGFSFEPYFKGHFPRQHGVPYDVLEGYGSVVVRAGWLQKVLPEFKELLEVTWHDDMLLCNLFEKHGIKRKTVYVPDCNVGQIKQYQYGFEADALHHIAGAGGHMSNNMQILKNLEHKGKNYFNFKCS